MQTFSEGRSVFQYYQDALADVRKRVLNMDDHSLLNTDEQVLVDRLLADKELEPPERETNRKIEFEPTKDVRTVRDLQFDEERLETIDMVIIEVPLVPKATNKLVLTLQPSSWTILLGGRVKAVFDDYNHILRFSTYPGDVENQLRAVESKIDNLRADIEKQTPPFRDQVIELVKSQRETVARSRGEIVQKMQSLGIELKSRPGAVEPVNVKVKEEARILRESSQRKGPEEYYLTQQTTDRILELIDRAGKGFELTPGSFAKLGEMDLRNIILGYLNAVFDTIVATGETFSHSGKPDIFINMHGRSLFVAECKYWGGKKRYQEEDISQLFGYTLWRQSVGAMIVFCKSKDLTKTVHDAEEGIKLHPTYKGGVQAIGDTRLVSTHKHPNDPDKTIRVHHLFFDLHAATAGETPNE